MFGVWMRILHYINALHSDWSSEKIKFCSTFKLNLYHVAAVGMHISKTACCLISAFTIQSFGFQSNNTQDTFPSTDI